MVVCRDRGRGRRAAGGSGGQAGPRRNPAQTRAPCRWYGRWVPVRSGRSPDPSPGDKGLAAPRARAAQARALRVQAGLGAYLGRPTRPGGRGCRSERRAAACSGRTARAAATAAAAAAAAAAAGRPPRPPSLSVSHRGGEEGGARPPGGTGGEGRHLGPRGGGGAVTATPRWRRQRAGVGAQSDDVMGTAWNSR